MQEKNCQALHKAQHQPLTEIKDRINVMQHHVSQFQTYKSYLLICLQFSLLHNMNQNLQNILNMCSRLLNIYASNYSKCLPICIHVQYSFNTPVTCKYNETKHKKQRTCNYVNNGGPKNNTLISRVKNYCLY